MMFMAGLVMAIAVEHCGLHIRKHLEIHLKKEKVRNSRHNFHL